MDTDKVENTKEVRTSEGARGGDKSLKENSHVTNEEFEECRERQSRNRTEKGLELDLEIGTKKRQRSMKDLRSRTNAIYASLREPADLAKLNACKDGLEVDLKTFQAAHENVTNLLIRLELPETEQEIHDEFLDVNNAALECLADIKVRIKDQEIERVELVLQNSKLRSRKSASSIRTSSTTSSKRAAIETAVRWRDELKLQEKELERLDEREELHGELSAAESIQHVRQRISYKNKAKNKEFPPVSQLVNHKRIKLPARKLKRKITKLTTLLLSEHQNNHQM